MRKSLSIAAAYIGLIVGAGFASGQEIVLFFTSFALPGILGACIALILFAYLGMRIVEYGARLQVTSHKELVRYLFGSRLAYLVDLIISLCLFGVSSVMIAGSGAMLAQQFHFHSVLASFLMTGIIMVTLCLRVEKVIQAISMLTPYLLVLMCVVIIYAVLASDGIGLEAAENLPSAVPTWPIAALLYVSFNLVIAFSMLAIIGGTEKQIDKARLGGCLGGLGIGLLLLAMNLGLLFHLEDLQGVPMPSLFIANKLSPFVGLLMALILIGMIYNTAVGSLYALTVRVISRENPFYFLAVMLICLAAFWASCLGFTDLVMTWYPLAGYLGLTLMLGLLFRSVRDWFEARRKGA